MHFSLPARHSHPSRGVRRMAVFLAAGVLAATTLAHAQAWSAKPVRLIVPFPVGTAPDVVARLLGERLGHAWGQAVVIENRAGAGGIPGMSTLVRSPADGYMPGSVPAAVATLTPLLDKNPQFNMSTEVTPIAMVGTSPMMVVVPQSSTVCIRWTNSSRQARPIPARSTSPPRRRIPCRT